MTDVVLIQKVWKLVFGLFMMYVFHKLADEALFARILKHVSKYVFLLHISNICPKTYFLKDLSICLKGRGKRRKGKEIYYPPFHSQIAATTQSRQVWSREPGIPSWSLNGCRDLWTRTIALGHARHSSQKLVDLQRNSWEWNPTWDSFVSSGGLTWCTKNTSPQINIF